MNIPLPHILSLKQKNRGGLILPAHSVVKVCEATERNIKRILNVIEGKMPRQTGIKHVISCSVLSELGSTSFESLIEHMLDTEPENNHIFSLISHISRCYCKIRIHHATRMQNDDLRKNPIRKELTKLILFSSQ